MYVTARNFIYDISWMFRKYFIVHVNDILYHQAILWGQNSQYLKGYFTRSCVLLELNQASSLWKTAFWFSTNYV